MSIPDSTASAALCIAVQAIRTGVGWTTHTERSLRNFSRSGTRSLITRGRVCATTVANCLDSGSIALHALSINKPAAAGAILDDARRVF